MDTYINTLSDLFYNNKRPLIIMEQDGSDCILNRECEILINGITYLNIDEIFPDIKLDKDLNRQSCLLKGSDKEIYFSLDFYSDNKKWVLEVDKDFATEWNEFVNYQKILHVIFLDLISVNTEKDLYKKLVEKATTLLKIDRIGILTYDHETEMVRGSWGTNSKGEIEDQSDYKEYLDKNSKVQEALALKDYVILEENMPLADRGKIIGQGWNATTAFFAGNKPIGWIACDNAINHEPLPNWKKEILGELSRMTGELVFHLRIEHHLTAKVEEKTRELERTIKELKTTQETLIEAEKMASLGSLVAGVSHEINTPVGIAITATSHMEETTMELRRKVESNTLRKKDLNSFINKNLEGSRLALTSLKKAGELITSFKQLAVNQTSAKKQKTNLREIINNVIISFQYGYNLKHVVINNNVDENISFNCNPGDIYQIFTNLISNSIIHGFNQSDKGIITIDASLKDKVLNIIYKDDGIGIPAKLHKKVFDPFFTTQRSNGRPGLGLNVIYNQILKLGGCIGLYNNNPSGILFKMNFKL